MDDAPSAGLRRIPLSASLEQSILPVLVIDVE
jgi:hypothetical protein